MKEKLNSFLGINEESSISDDKSFLFKNFFSDNYNYKDSFSNINNKLLLTNHYNNTNKEKENHIIENLNEEEKLSSINIFNLSKIEENEINPKNNFLGKKKEENYIEKHVFKKNRNYLTNKIKNKEESKLKKNYTENEKQEKINTISTINVQNFFQKNLLSPINFKNEIKNDFSSLLLPKSDRVDSLLIKFKVKVGKSFITFLNKSIKELLKRKIKFFSFNYKKFTINVNYTKNCYWLNEKIKNLLVLGDENNQKKNQKSLKLLFNRKEKEIEKIKKILELNYQQIIEKFYETNDYKNFVNDNKIIQLDNNFKKIFGMSLIEKNGFIKFIYSRKGNQKNKENNEVKADQKK